MSTGSGRAAASGIVSPASKPLDGVAGDDLQVLEPERRLRPDDHRRVDRDRLGDLVEAEAEFGARSCRRLGHFDRDDRLDDPDPGAADPHLVAFDQRLRVRHLGLEVVGGDEGQAVVGVVGEEDRDQDRPAR